MFDLFSFLLRRKIRRCIVFSSCTIGCTTWHLPYHLLLHSLTWFAFLLMRRRADTAVVYSLDCIHSLSFGRERQGKTGNRCLNVNACCPLAAATKKKSTQKKGSRWSGYSFSPQYAINQLFSTWVSNIQYPIRRGCGIGSRFVTSPTFCFGRIGGQLLYPREEGLFFKRELSLTCSQTRARSQLPVPLCMERYFVESLQSYIVYKCRAVRKGD